MLSPTEILGNYWFLDLNEILGHSSFQTDSPYDVEILTHWNINILARDMHLATTKIRHNILKKTIRSWSDPKTEKGSRGLLRPNFHKWVQSRPARGRYSSSLSNTSALESTEKTPNHYMLTFSTLGTQVSLILYIPLTKANSYQFEFLLNRKQRFRQPAFEPQSPPLFVPRVMIILYEITPCTRPLIR